MITRIYNPILQYYMRRSAKTNEICKYVIKNKSSGIMILYREMKVNNKNSNSVCESFLWHCIKL